MVQDPAMEEVAAILRRCLEDGFPVEIEGLGLFRRSAAGKVEFVPEKRPKVFIAYSEEDFAHAELLFELLAAYGFDPWLDKKRLLPGQNWPRAIENAISVSDFFIACFSRHGVTKRGHFHSELRYALDCASRIPVGAIYFIPVRLDNCQVPARITREIQYVDLFPAWDKGFERVLSALRKAGRTRLKPPA